MQQIPFTVTKLNTVYTGVFNSEFGNFDWISGPKSSKPRWFDATII